MTWDEDRSQVRTGNGPQVMGSLRNIAITIPGLADETNIAAARRHHASNPTGWDRSQGRLQVGG